MEIHSENLFFTAHDYYKLSQCSELSEQPAKQAEWRSCYNFEATSVPHLSPIQIVSVIFYTSLQTWRHSQREFATKSVMFTLTAEENLFALFLAGVGDLKCRT
jgi:hypothetical protein